LLVVGVGLQLEQEAEGKGDETWVATKERRNLSKSPLVRGIDLLLRPRLTSRNS
jgi:hypothetical protein